MNITPTPESSRPGALDAVVSSFEAAWQRVVQLMFKGPHANFVGWATWGLVSLLAAATGGSFPGGGGSWGGPPRGHESLDSVAEFRDVLMPYLPLILLGFLLVVGLVIAWLFIQSRFRIVLLENVLAGRPRIRQVFGATARAGNAYFRFELFFAVAALVVILVPVLLIWAGTIRDGLSGASIPGASVVGTLLLTIIWVVPVVIGMAVIDWFAYDLVLPYLYRGNSGIAAAFGDAWRTTQERPVAVLVFLMARFLVGFAAGLAMMLVFCLSCFVWGLPMALAIGLVAATVAVPWLCILTVPLALLLFLAVAWIISTITAPVVVFHRAWSWSFLATIDPHVPALAAPDERLPDNLSE